MTKLSVQENYPDHEPPYTQPGTPKWMRELYLDERMDELGGKLRRYDTPSWPQGLWFYRLGDATEVGPFYRSRDAQAHAVEGAGVDGPGEPATPEANKAGQRRAERDAAKSFLDHLQAEEGLVLAAYNPRGDNYVPRSVPLDNLLAKWLGYDGDEAVEEISRMVAYMAWKNDPRERNRL